MWINTISSSHNGYQYVRRDTIYLCVISSSVNNVHFPRYNALQLFGRKEAKWFCISMLRRTINANDFFSENLLLYNSSRLVNRGWSFVVRYNRWNTKLYFRYLPINGKSILRSVDSIISDPGIYCQDEPWLPYHESGVSQLKDLQIK